MSLNINIGCGQTPTEGWRNFDNTPSIKLAKSPVKYFLLKFLRLLNIAQIENVEWNKKNSIEFADATKKLPLPNDSVNCVYTSHMFEHLSIQGGKNFLKESLRILKKGGVLRISVPDLDKYVEAFLLHKDADKFMKRLHVSAPPIDILQNKFKLLFLSGYRHHQWMYNGKSLEKLIVEAGFRNVIFQKPGKTIIENSGKLNLFERYEESIYIEAIK